MIYRLFIESILQYIHYRIFVLCTTLSHAFWLQKHQCMSGLQLHQLSGLVKIEGNTFSLDTNTYYMLEGQIRTYSWTKDVYGT